MNIRTNPNKGKGFASMHPLKQKEIASLGGKAAHLKGTAHTWNHDEAVAAGKLAGVSRHMKKDESVVE
jgi:hypothetical protein